MGERRGTRTEEGGKGGRGFAGGLTGEDYANSERRA